MPRPPNSAYQRIYTVVRRIPRGRVATYGQVAQLAGLPGHARQVGYALHALPSGSGVPWQRVINARGEVSVLAVRGAELSQRFRLEAEGVEFDIRGRVALSEFGWRPAAAPRTASPRQERAAPRPPARSPAARSTSPSRP